MTRYLLDTNVCIYLIKRRPARVLARLRQIDPSEAALSSITLSELLYGVAKSSRPGQNRAALGLFLTPFEILPYDDRAAEAYGRIRCALERRGRPIGPLDLLIAAHALSVGAVLVTHNTREFARVPGLDFEDWAAVSR